MTFKDKPCHAKQKVDNIKIALNLLQMVRSIKCYPMGLKISFKIFVSLQVEEQGVVCRRFHNNLYTVLCCCPEQTQPAACVIFHWPLSCYCFCAKALERWHPSLFTPRPGPGWHLNLSVTMPFENPDVLTDKWIKAYAFFYKVNENPYNVHHPLPPPSHTDAYTGIHNSDAVQ